MAAGPGRPPVLPRERMTPLGEVLAKRGITARGLGEAVAITEGRPERIPTIDVNRWIWGQRDPAPRRREVIADLLKLPRDELFPPKPRRPPKPRKPQKPGGADLQLITAAADLAPDHAAGAAVLARAAAQTELPEGVIPMGDSRSIIERKAARERARTARDTPLRRAA